MVRSADAVEKPAVRAWTYKCTRVNDLRESALSLPAWRLANRPIARLH